MSKEDKEYRRAYENPMDFIPTMVLIDELRRRSDEGVEVLNLEQQKLTVVVWRRGNT